MNRMAVLIHRTRVILLSASEFSERRSVRPRTLPIKFQMREIQ